MPNVFKASFAAKKANITLIYQIWALHTPNPSGPGVIGVLLIAHLTRDYPCTVLFPWNIYIYLIYFNWYRIDDIISIVMVALRNAKIPQEKKYLYKAEGYFTEREPQPVHKV